MKKILTYLMLLSASSDAYININRQIRKPTKVKLSCNLSDNANTLIRHFSDFNSDCKTIIGKKIVVEISSILPKVDTIGHKVLHANNEFIVDVLSWNNNIPDEIKKNVILGSIKLAQHGDNLGSFFLQLYYDIVDKCL